MSNLYPIKQIKSLKHWLAPSMSGLLDMYVQLQLKRQEITSALKQYLFSIQFYFELTLGFIVLGREIILQ